jgi:ABC-type dipeptide/oligopeptide/nickel transport system permease component
VRAAVLITLAILISAAVFLLATWVFFVTSNSFVTGNSLIVGGCPRITPAMLQEYKNFYGLDQPIYAQYSLWLINGLGGQTGPPIGACFTPQPSYGLSFQWAILVWIIITIAEVAILVAVAMRTKRQTPQSSDVSEKADFGGSSRP